MSIDNCDNIIDSRDVIARIAELEEERDDWDEDDEPGRRNWEDANEDEAAELSNLQDLAEQCQYYGDWAHGATLINESYFEKYARELASDCGMISGGESWPLNCIDWEQAANELMQDYTVVDFDGTTFYMRS